MPGQSWYLQRFENIFRGTPHGHDLLSVSFKTTCRVGAPLCQHACCVIWHLLLLGKMCIASPTSSLPCISHRVKDVASLFLPQTAVTATYCGQGGPCVPISFACHAVHGLLCTCVQSWSLCSRQLLMFLLMTYVCIQSWSRCTVCHRHMRSGCMCFHYPHWQAM
jgi:hypothetical protein